MHDVSPVRVYAIKRVYELCNVNYYLLITEFKFNIRRRARRLGVISSCKCSDAEADSFKKKESSPYISELYEVFLIRLQLLSAWCSVRTHVIATRN